jgi:hypothetical protein
VKSGLIWGLIVKVTMQNPWWIGMQSTAFAADSSKAD